MQQKSEYTLGYTHDSARNTNSRIHRKFVMNLDDDY